MEPVEIPSFFVCPISLEIMRDPVTLPTGITYDRDSIERWVFSNNKKHCPVTKQPLPADCSDVTPNHTLRRLIQSWCATSNSVDRIPTPRPPVDRAHVERLLADADAAPPHSLIKTLKTIVSDSERNRRCVGSIPATLDFLVAAVKNSEMSSLCEDALYILHSLQISEEGLVDLISRNPDFIESLTSVLQQYSKYHHARLYATLILKSIVAVIAPARLVSLPEELFRGMVRVLRDRISQQATKAALRVLGDLVPWGRNRIKAVAAGAVAALVELLLEEQDDRRTCEMVLVVLDRLCSCAEGRAELVGHAAGVAVVSKKILRVSQAANERAVKVLHSVCKYSATPAVLKEMLQVGAVSKLCWLVQVECGEKAKEKAREVLRWHARVWRKAPCLSPHMQALYPS